jgi:glycogen operon protein
MLLMGDEVRRTQQGNNNAYCQDNETSWFDWTLLAKRADVHRFVRLLNAQRVLRDEEPERQRLSLNQLLRKAKKAWHGVKLGQPDWGEFSHSLAFSVEAPKETLLFHVILNAYWEPLDFELPSAGDQSQDSWRRWIDTSLDPPQDIVEWQCAPPVPGRTYRAGPRSVVVLFARAGDGANPSAQSGSAPA